MDKDDVYFASAGALKLKGVADSGIKKKKKKKKKERDLEIRRKTIETSDESTEDKLFTTTRTNAEIKFDERRRKREEERILKKASKTHKEKVEDFNRHLDRLTEHFDIPKVSWTK